MIILGLDTTAESCSAALWCDGEVYSKLESTPRSHTRRLMPMIRSLLEEQGLTPAEITAVAFGRGPGSFTGLRIAAGVTKGLAFGLGCPVVPVSSLAACALQAWQERRFEQIAVAFDARMDEVYWGCYTISEGNLLPLGEEQVRPPETVALSGRGQDQDQQPPWFGVGDGWRLSARMPRQVTGAMTAIDESLVPTAEAVVRLGAQDFAKGLVCTPEEAAPVYLRDSVAWQKLPGR